MDRLTLIDMFSKFFAYLGKNPLFIAIFVIFVLVYFYLILSPVFTNKHKRLYTLFLLAGIIALIIIYGKTFWEFLDYLIDNIFVIIYFPNLPAYVVMVIITIIIFIITMFKEDIAPVVKRINTAVFLLIIFFLILAANIVVSKSLNVYSEISIYSNITLAVMIQFTMIIFALWMVALLVIRLIHIFGKKADKVEEEKIVEENKKVAPPVQTVTASMKSIVPIAMEHKDEDMFTLEGYRLLYEYLKKIKENNKGD